MARVADLAGLRDRGGLPGLPMLSRARRPPVTSADPGCDRAGEHRDGAAPPQYRPSPDRSVRRRARRLENRNASTKTAYRRDWKMNGRRAEGIALAQELAELAKGAHACDLLVCRGHPPGNGSARRSPAAARARWPGLPTPWPGPYTGCISAEMLRIAAASMSSPVTQERRHGLGESDAMSGPRPRRMARRARRDPLRRRDPR